MKEGLLLIRESIQLPPRYTVPADTEEVRNELALAARQIKGVTSAEANNQAGIAVKDIRKYLKATESLRVDLTRPLLDAQRQLKALMDDHCAPLIAEQERLENLGKQFAEWERKRVADEERKRSEEIARLERERIEKEQAVERERQRFEADHLAAQRKAVEEAAKIKNKANREAFEAEQKRLSKQRADDAAEAEQERIEQANRAEQLATAAIVAPLPEVDRVRGQSTKNVLRYEVTDIRALAVARPDLVRMEPNAAGILATCIPEMPNLPPGLRLWYEVKVTYTSR